MKKSLITTIVVGLVLAVSFSIYTICYAVGGIGVYVPKNYEYTIAYRTGDIVNELVGFNTDDGSLALTFEEGVEEANYPISLTEEGKYEVKNAGKFTAVIIAENGDKTTYSVNTYLKGNGTELEPLTICNAAHLVEYQALTVEDKNALAYHLNIVSDIDLTGVDYRPIGNNHDPFTGVVNGNGYTVKNMSISVNAENYTDYVAQLKPNYSIELGFFGKTVNAEILDLNFNDAKIVITSDVYTKLINRDYNENAAFNTEKLVGKVSIGTVAGIMTRTTYSSSNDENIEVVGSTIRGFSYNAAPDNLIPSGMGTIAGVITETQISNVFVDSDIYADYLITEGSRVGGIVGFIAPEDTSADLVAGEGLKTKIEKVVVSSEIYTRYYLGEEVETALGAKDYENYFMDKYNTVGLICAIATNADILDIEVKNSRILGNETYLTLDLKNNNNELPSYKYLALLSGGVANAYSDSETLNTYMSGVVIDGVYANPAARFGGVVGYAYDNTVIEDSVVKNLEARTAYTGGYAYEVDQNATIKFSSDFAGKEVVNVNLSGVRVAALVLTNKGSIIGADTVEAGKSIVKSNISGYGAGIQEKINTADLVFASGLIGYMYNNISSGNETKVENFKVDAYITNSVNIVGAVYMLGEGLRIEEHQQAVANAVLNNIEIELDAISHTHKTDLSMTKKVAGAVGVARNFAIITHVDVKQINLNQGVDSSAQSYGAAIFGGLVAHILGDDVAVTIDACKVSGNVYINKGWWTVSQNNDATGSTTRYIVVAGGLVGMISNEEYMAVNLSGISIMNNSVTALIMNIDGEFKTNENEVFGGEFYTVRGIGALIGNINNKTESTSTLDLASNSVIDVVEDPSDDVRIYVNFEAFRYKDSLSIDKILVGATTGSEDGLSAIGSYNDFVLGGSYIKNIPTVSDETYVDTSKAA